ncbi:MAG: AAA family ATPase [Shimia sp.]
MRLRRLSLDRFGHFIDHAFDFGPRPDGADFHVIYGPNEAGKTTTMEGYLRLLFGWAPRNEPYDFHNNRSLLRVGAVVEGRDGTPRSLIRQGTALTDGDGAALPDSALQDLLGGLDDREYRNRFCLNREVLNKGGKAIAESQGDLGTLLFSAASGLGDLTQTLDAMRKEAEAIHKPKGRTTRIALLGKRKRELEALVKADDAATGALRGMEDALAKAEAEATRTAAAKADAGTARDARQAERQAYGPFHAALQARAAAEGLPAHTLPPGLTDEALTEAEHQRIALDSEAREIARQRADLIARTDALEDDPTALSLRDNLSGLVELRNRCAAALSDLPRRRSEAAEAWGALLRYAPLGASDPLAYALSSGQLKTLRDAASALSTAETRLAERQIAARTAQATLDDLPAVDPSLVERAAALRSAQTIAEEAGAKALAAELETAEGEAARTARAAQEACATLGGPLRPSTLTAEDLAALTTRLDAAQGAVDLARSRLAETEAEVARLSALPAPAGLPDLAALDAVRAERDRLWQAHRSTLDADSADRFERAMDADDSAQANARDRAKALADHAAQRDRLAEAQATLAGAVSAARAADKGLAAEERARAAHATALGLPSEASPAVLQTHLAALGAAQEAESIAKAAEARAKALRERARDVSKSVAPHLGAPAPRTLAAALARLAELDGALRPALAVAETEARARQDAEEKARDATAQARLAAQDHEAAQADWAQAVEATFGELPHPPLDAEGLEALQALADAAGTYRGLADRVASMESDAAALSAALAPLASALDMEDEAPVALYDRIAARIESADATATERARLSEAAARLDAREQKAVEARETLTARLALWSEAAGLAEADVATLRGLLAEARNRAKLLEDAATQELAAQRALGVSRPDDAAQRLAEWSEPALETACEDAEAVYEAADAAHADALEALGRARAEREALAHDTEAAAARTEISTLELEIEAEARDWLTLRLGTLLADGAIEAHRKANRPEMLAEAEAAFAAITDGRYPRLGIERPGAQEVLLAYDAAGVAKGIGAMSEGQRGQLFLALRAGAYATAAARGQALPFLCDDVFESFDDTRTAEACALMVRIGRQGQAIYFTHHRHVVDIAREVSGGAVRIHELPDSAKRNA